MNTIQLAPTLKTTDLMMLADADLQAFFARYGLEAEVVGNCDDATCPDCFAPAKAA